MRIILDGCDGTGKSTIAEKLANEYGCNIIRLTHRGDTSLKAYYQMMSCDNVIHDRSFMSEIIYSKYFGRTCTLDFDHEMYLHQLMKNLSIQPFILIASRDTIKERILYRGDDYIDDIDKLIKINRDYIKYANEHNIPIISTTGCTPDDVVKKIGGYLI